MVGTTRSRVSFFMNRFPQARLYRIQRSHPRSQIVAQRRSARLKLEAKHKAISPVRLHGCRDEAAPRHRRDRAPINQKHETLPSYGPCSEDQSSHFFRTSGIFFDHRRVLIYPGVAD